MNRPDHISNFAAAQAHPTAARLVSWYDRNHRDLPWRVSPGRRAAGHSPNPYHVWLSEIMLQQTTVAAVRPYFLDFLDRWPDVEKLAAAPSEEVMKAWAGLGYYSRARNLKKCAGEIAGAHGGHFPTSAGELQRLPGIGPYTAAAIAAIAFDEPVAVVDGNVERVATRLFAIETPLPEAKPIIGEKVAGLVPRERPGDFAQAMMDLGATICTPRKPKCMICPLHADCLAGRDGDPERLPVRATKAAKPLRRGAAFVAISPEGAVLLRRRPESGLLGGMSEVATTGWTARQDGRTDMEAAPFPAPWRRLGAVNHVFTHFALELTVYSATVERTAPQGYWWSQPEAIPHEALPNLMKKVVEAAAPGITRKPPRPGRSRSRQ